MRLLLDTQVWLWTLVNPARIKAEVGDLLRDPENRLVLSAASSWEIAIKYRLGKLHLPEPPETFVLPRLRRDGIEALPIEHHHACAVATLPPHHGDPFDRLLIAVARTENLTLVTADLQLQAYDVPLILA
ncbi:MAG: type II toxin-antitoxin system VapC family toxin [Candidatus Latescibacterota bacterium]|jgi:PIN domain nuclease of toxin-antitoxin system